MTNECPLCGLEMEDTDLARYYLREIDLVRFIQGVHMNWIPQDGACARCLEAYHREWNAQEEPTGETEENTIITEASDLPETAGEAGMACLVTLHGADLGRKHDMDKDVMIVGRSETADIRINEDNVSRNHAKIFRKKSDVFIEDLKSTNGTLVNTRRVKTAKLKDGDIILLGSTILKFMSGATVEQLYHEEIYRLATLDGLTKVLNKSFFLEKLTDEFRRSRRYSRDLSLIIYDFDNFKTINDTYGHQAGDHILAKTASIVRSNVRKEDICGRYGGEEFVVLLPETKLETAVILAEKLRKLVASSEFAHKGRPIDVTVSMGIATLTQDIMTARQFIEMSDRAMYRAKQDGRNCSATVQDIT